jgi:hypothetical protein
MEGGEDYTVIHQFGDVEVQEENGAWRQVEMSRHNQNDSIILHFGGEEVEGQDFDYALTGGVLVAGTDKIEWRKKNSKTPAAKGSRSNSDSQVSPGADACAPSSLNKRVRKVVNYSGGDAEDEDYSSDGDSSSDEDDDYARTVSKKARTAAGSELKVPNVTKPKGLSKPKGLKALEKQLKALPRDQLCAAVVAFLAEDPELVESFVASLPAPDISSFLVSLSTASRAISRALPNSRWGSNSDHYGYKRCSSAVTAFKKLWNEQVVTLVDGDKSAFAEYCRQAAEVLDYSVDFDCEKDNKYKSLCSKKMATALTKALKAKDLSADTRQSLTSTSSGLRV